MNLEQMKFPIGQFSVPSQYSKILIQAWVEVISTFPQKLISISSDLSIDQLNWKYRPDGWSIKQVIHHCADSHMNSLIRFKLTLTEKKPIIKPYLEGSWANLIDSQDNNIENSIKIIEGIHGKWTQILHHLSDEELKLLFIHPESKKEISIQENIGIYAWHCKHHLAHIQQAISAKGQFN